MTDDRIDQRAADLLPEERAAGSADPRAQAEAILAESDEREAESDEREDATGDGTEPADGRRAGETTR